MGNAAPAAPPTCEHPKVLHLAPDDKFMPFVRRVYEAAFPGHNRFRIMAPGSNKGQFVEVAEDLKLVGWSYWFSAALREDLEWCDLLIVHFMTPWFARAVAAAPPQVTVVWGAWGGDFYHLIARPDAMYLPETSRLLAALPFRRKRHPERIFSRAIEALARALLLPRWERDVLDRIDAATMLPSEHRMLAAAQPRFRARHYQLHYYSAEELQTAGPPEMRGRDILLGNSATPTNNHLDAFSLLRRLDLDGRNVVVPLSYGDKQYGEEICRAGNRLFGKRFVPLRKFMPLDEFNHVVSTCSTVLMNHVRQQAFGTVNTALLSGAKAFLRPENPLRAFYRDLGAFVCELAQDKVNSETFFQPLSEAQRRANRQAILDFCSYEQAVRSARGLAGLVAEKRGSTVHV